MSVSSPASVINQASSSPASSSSPSSTSNSTSSATSSALNTSESQFLQLLTTQMQNQDPTSPMDDNTMMQQIGELSSLNAQLQTNASLQSLASEMQANMVNSAVNYIGADVTANGNQVVLNSNSSSSSGSAATINYSLASAAQNVTVTITNSAGNVVFSGPGSTNAGQNQIFWDGTQTSGGTAPNGTYTFSVKATDSSGNPVTTTTATSGVVQSVTIQNGTAMLDLGNNVTVPASSVTTISQSPFAASAGTGGTGG